MGFVVKNTTKCGLLDLLCPHTCRRCGQLGAVLCERCKKYMLEHYEAFCPICKEPFAKTLENVGSGEEGANNGAKVRKNVNNVNKAHVCPECEVSLDGLWAFGWREGALEKLVEEYKYQSLRAAGTVLVEFLDAMLPKDLGEDIVVVPLPTIGKHIRERGLDHTWEVGKKLAKRRGWKCQRLIARAVDTVQVGSKVAERKAQAEKAYMINGEVDADKKYLLLDDVWTTGSTMLAAERVLREAGAKRVCGVVLAVSK